MCEKPPAPKVGNYCCDGAKPQQSRKATPRVTSWSLLLEPGGTFQYFFCRCEGPFSLYDVPCEAKEAGRIGAKPIHVIQNSMQAPCPGRAQFRKERNAKMEEVASPCCSAAFHVQLLSKSRIFTFSYFLIYFT